MAIPCDGYPNGNLSRMEWRICCILYRNHMLAFDASDRCCPSVLLKRKDGIGEAEDAEHSNTKKTCSEILRFSAFDADVKLCATPRGMDCGCPDVRCARHQEHKPHGTANSPVSCARISSQKCVKNTSTCLCTTRRYSQ